MFAAKSTMTNSPDFWSVGHLVTKTLTSSLSWKTEMCGFTVRGNSPEGRSVANDHELQSALAKMKKNETKGARLFGMCTWNQRQSWSETLV